MKFTAGQLAALINGTVEGDAGAVVNTYSKIEEAHEGSLTFLANPNILIISIQPMHRLFLSATIL